MPDYKNISLKKEMMDEIEQFINDYPELGFRSLAQFVEDAVRRRKDELKVSERIPRFEHKNTFSDRISITDKKFLGKEFDIYIQDKGKLRCENDESNDCVHVQFILEQHKIMKQLEQRGWKPKS